MSINGKEIARLTVPKAENVIKSVPRGSVKITAMVPKKYKPTKEELPTIVTSPPASGRNEEEGVVNVKVS